MPPLHKHSPDYDDSDVPTLNASKKSVSFSNIHVREHSRIIGDNPSCRSGPPISLGWDFIDFEPEELNSYEERRLPRRRKNHLVMTSITRSNILANHFGYSVMEIQAAEKSVKRYREWLKNGSIIRALFRKVKRALILN